VVRADRLRQKGTVRGPAPPKNLEEFQNAS
jgi:hypothetical protein